MAGWKIDSHRSFSACTLRLRTILKLEGALGAYLLSFAMPQHSWNAGTTGQRRNKSPGRKSPGSAERGSRRNRRAVEIGKKRRRRPVEGTRIFHQCSTTTGLYSRKEFVREAQWKKYCDQQQMIEAARTRTKSNDDWPFNELRMSLHVRFIFSKLQLQRVPTIFLARSAKCLLSLG